MSLKRSAQPAARTDPARGGRIVAARAEPSPETGAGAFRHVEPVAHHAAQFFFTRHGKPFLHFNTIWAVGFEVELLQVRTCDIRCTPN